MLETRALELINAGIDGELDAGGRAELEQLLAASAEARAMQAELQKLASAIDRMPELEPPDDLADRIIGQALLRRRRPPLSLSRLFRSFQPLQSGLAFAAGLLMTVGVYELAQDRRSAEDVASMVGTMVARSQDSLTPQERRLDISGPGVVGQVTLSDTGELVVLGIDIAAEREVEIVLALADAGLNFGGIAREVSGERGIEESYQVSGGELRVVNDRSHPFNVYLRRGAANEARARAMGIEVIHSGERVFEGSLEMQGASR